ncbi:indole-3-glycerol phosphate synthase TrpC [Clostridium sp. SHJSY1]|uniref:indole-3-glycerol phosphate synthase TrpC n=1 Tax=Clostridium sp. SHJSY1 TaxID=2942483 RepID=UPI00287570A5|nr:indole-3-glycerol phosphate synthase TrpC [Clostridium sp. SHJSY1]MDS0524477.1 indole-3-glycerol phosphate synthase TrpC [Clostridium sp. SHJSY1]
MILDKICKQKYERVEYRKKIISIEKLYEKSNKLISVENNFKKALGGDSFSIIGEYKKASPSKGVIVEDFDIEKIAKMYSELKIDAYSVLTEEDFFRGSDEYLKKVKQLSDRPILRKDFVIDFYQIYEAKTLGASGILLISAILGKDLKKFYDECRKINLYPLVEVHNRKELELALECGSEIIGINNRDLRNFDTTLKTTEDLIKYVPKDKIIISESGMKDIDDLKTVKNLGANGALVGEMFMRNIENQSFKEEFNLFKGE